MVINVSFDLVFFSSDFFQGKKEGKGEGFFWYTTIHTQRMYNRLGKLKSRILGVVMGILLVYGYILYCNRPMWDTELPFPLVFNQTVVLSHYDESLSYIHEIPVDAYTIYVYTHRPLTHSLTRGYPANTRFRSIPNLGVEGLAYVQYILDHYDSLPHKILFMHAHPKSWHQEWDVLQILQRVVWEHPTEYCSVNDYPFTMIKYDIHVQGSVELWNTIFADSYGDIPLYLEGHCCAQFVVSSKAIHQYPYKKWEQMRDYLVRDNPLYDSKQRAISFERLWKYIFTRTTTLDKRQDLCWFSSN